MSKSETAYYRIKSPLTVPASVMEPPDGQAETTLARGEVVGLPTGYGEHLVSLRIAERTKALEKLTKDELLALAAERDIEIAASSTKAEIIEALGA